MLPAKWRKICRQAVWGAMVSAVAGCAFEQPKIHYFGKGDHRYYRNYATEIEYPVVATETAPELAASAPPHTIRDLERCEIRELLLAEAVHTALINSEIIRRNADFLSPGNSLLVSPESAPSVFDPAIQESGVLFGNRGVEAALSDFDAQLTTQMIWGREETLQNNPFFGGGVGGGGALVNDTAMYQSSLSKSFANGGTVQFNHNVDYLWSSAFSGPASLFNSVYTGNIEVLYQQPLLAGAGTEFTRTAGPIARSFGGITGVSQGVLIARINNDIEIAAFERSVQNLVLDVENAYWDLYLAYRTYDTAVEARDSALETWRLTEKQAGEVLIPADEAQARGALHAAEAAAQTALSNIYTAETRLRRLMAVEVNDNTIFRPASTPVTAELIPDWYSDLTQALTHRVDLRQQKWRIKSLDLQLKAARSLTQPRLDFLAGYRVNAFGDNLIDYDGPSINSYAQTLTANNHTGWNLGFQMNWPIGFRSAHAQVRSYELRLLKAQEALAQQELEIGHELAASYQELARAFATLQSNRLRYEATRENVRGLEPRVLTEDNVDVILRAYQRRAEAEQAYYASLVDYNKALADLQYRKGTALAYNNVHLMEGPWVPEAYDDADRHGRARAYAHPAKHVDDAPEPFVSDAPVGRVTFTSEAAVNGGNGAIVPVPDAPPPAPPAEFDDGSDVVPPPPPATEDPFPVKPGSAAVPFPATPRPFPAEPGSAAVPPMAPAEPVQPAAWRPFREPGADSQPPRTDNPTASRNIGNQLQMPTRTSPPERPTERVYELFDRLPE
ncbi:MAG: TolC family protein [Planctomycetota bacterium]|nr:MAG: TolC family protein [Planctomycetota bacterium]REK24806.1 MAG: TolC family protein [Planctomycetota bacterium]REK38835.1 MAG: TolC family protein [Planctomycetota bacterium]